MIDILIDGVVRHRHTVASSAEPTPSPKSPDTDKPTSPEAGDDSWSAVVDRIDAANRAREERAAREKEQRRLDAEAQVKRRLEWEAQERAREEAEDKEHAERHKAYEREITALVDAGDVEGVLARLDRRLMEPDHHFAESMARVRSVLEIAARKDPQKLYAVMGARIAAWQSLLWVRSQYVAAKLILRLDLEGGPPYGDLPKSVLDVWLPRLETIGHSIRETATAFARIHHTMQLGDGKQTTRKQRAHHEHSRHPTQSREPSAGSQSRNGRSPTEPTGSQHPSKADDPAAAAQGDAGTAGRASATV